MSDRVKAILKEIQKLPDDERVEFRSGLTKMEERELKRLQTDAGKWARKHGITDDRIREIVEKGRYGTRKQR